MALALLFLAAAAAAIAANPAAKNGGWWPKSGLGCTKVGLDTSMWLSLMGSSSSSSKSSSGKFHHVCTYILHHFVFTAV